MDLTKFYELQKKEQELKAAIIAVENEAKRLLEVQAEENLQKQIQTEKDLLEVEKLNVEKAMKMEIEIAVRLEIGKQQKEADNKMSIEISSTQQQEREKIAENFEERKRHAEAMADLVKESVESIASAIKTIEEQPINTISKEVIAANNPMIPDLPMDYAGSLIVSTVALGIVAANALQKDHAKDWEKDIAQKEQKIIKNFEESLADTREIHEKMQRQYDKKFEGDELNQKKAELAVTMNKVEENMKKEWEDGKTLEQTRLKEEKNAYNKAIETTRTMLEIERQREIARQREAYERSLAYTK